MADLLYEHFDALTPAQLASTQAWSVVGAGVVSTTARTGLGVTGTAGASVAENTLRTRLLSAFGRGYFGQAVRWSTFPASLTAFWALLDTAGSPLITLACGPTGTIAVYQGTAGGTLLGTSGVLFSGGATWDYLEVGPVIGTSGSVEIRVRPDGAGTLTQAFVLTGVDTQPGAVSAWAQTEVYLSERLTLDDVYISDINGPRNIYFKGRTAIWCTVPAVDHTPVGAAGFAWTPSTGADKFAVIDERPANDDVDYLYARSGGVMEFEIVPLAPDTARADGVQVTVVARQISSLEDQSLAVWIRDPSSGPVSFVLLSRAAMPTAYRAYSYLSNFRPSAPIDDWGTVAQVNAAWFGVNRSA